MQLKRRLVQELGLPSSLVRGPAPFRRTEPEIGRNDPCPCGSGKKYKRCHTGTPAGQIISDGEIAAWEARTEELRTMMKQLGTDAVGREHPTAARILGIFQNIFRRAYFGLSEEDERTQTEVLDRIKETALRLVLGNAQTEEGMRFFEKFLRVKGRYTDYRTEGLGDTAEATLRAKVRAKITGRESFDAAQDFCSPLENTLPAYRERAGKLIREEEVRDPLVVGVLVAGCYYAASFYLSALAAGLKPDLVLLQKARYQKRVDALPSEAKKIRRALGDDRDIIVVDDIVHGFGSFFSIFDYFGQPGTMRFSAALYTSPLPKELDILERRSLQRAYENPGLASALDRPLTESLRMIARYRMGVDREDRKITVLPPGGF